MSYYNEENPMNLRDAVISRILELSSVKNKNIALKDLCRKVNLSYDTLMSFINGRTRIINLETLYKVCCGLDISLKEFFSDKIFDYLIDEHEPIVRKYGYRNR